MKLVNIHILTFSLLLLGSYNVLAQRWSLQRCIDTASVHNRSLQIKRNSVAISQQKNKEAGATLLPSITANAEYKYYTDLPYQLMPQAVFGGPEGEFREAQFGVPHNINANLQLTMPLYNSQIFGAIRASEIAVEISELQYRKTEEELFFEISNLYYNAQILQQQLIFLDSNLINTERLLQNMQLLHEQLLATGTDVLKVTLEAEQLRVQRQLASSRHQQVLNALKLSIGLPMDYKLQIESVVVRPESTEYEIKPSPDQLLVRMQHELKASELKTTQMSRLPSVALFATYGTTGFGYDEGPDNFLDFYPIGFAGVRLSLPLFNGTATNRKINQKRLEVESMELQIALTDDNNTMQIQNAQMQRQVTLLSVATIEKQVHLAMDVYEQTVLQQKQGIASLTEVLMADNALREAQQTYISAVVDYLKADLELKKLTGNFLVKNNN